MTNPPPPDWLGAGSDLLKEKIGDHAADLLEAGLAAIEILEEGLRHALGPPQTDDLPRYIERRIAVVARARGETPEQTIARLTPEGPRIEFSNEEWNWGRVENVPAAPADWFIRRDGIGGVHGTLTKELYPGQVGGLSADLVVIDEALSGDTPDPGPIPHRRSTLAGYLGPRLAGGHAAPRESRRRRRTP